MKLLSLVLCLGCVWPRLAGAVTLENVLLQSHATEGVVVVDEAGRRDGVKCGGRLAPDVCVPVREGGAFYVLWTSDPDVEREINAAVGERRTLVGNPVQVGFRSGYRDYDFEVRRILPAQEGDSILDLPSIDP